LSRFTLSQTCSNLQNDSIEDSGVNNRVEKIYFTDLVKDAESVAGFLLAANFESDEMTSHKQNGFLRSGFFFRKAGTSEGKTSVSGKAECLLAIGEDKKVSFLE